MTFFRPEGWRKLRTTNSEDLPSSFPFLQFLLIFFRSLACEQGSLMRVPGKFWRRSVQRGKILAGYPLSDFAPHYNLVPRALFPGSKAKEKLPGDEVRSATLHSNGSRSRGSFPHKRSFAISTSRSSLNLVRPFRAEKRNEYA